ncbi:MAG: TolC family protein [Bacteroidales bacterium]|jgi:outer membrane protein|nr:TolC family protein [Bacteroidales bacterium]
MKNTKSTLLILFLALGSIGLKAQTGEPLSLKSAIDIMLEKNFDIQIVEKRLESSKLNIGLGSAGFYPIIDVGAAQNNRYDNAKAVVTANSRDESVSNSIRPYVQLNWTLFNGFAAHIKKDRYNLIEDLSEGNVALVVENKIQAVVLAYYQSLLNIEKLKSIEKVKKLSSDRFEYMQTKQNIGAAVSYDVLQAQNAFLSDSTTFLLQQLELKKSLLNLNLLMGVDKTSEFELSDNFTVLEADYNFETIEAQMMSSNKTITNQYINQEILKKNTAFSRTALYPNLRLSSGSDYSNSALLYDGMTRNTSYSYDFYANFSLSFNLFNGGNTRSAIQDAHIQEEIGQIEIEQMKQSLSNAMVSIFDMYSIRKQLLNVADLSLEKAELNLELSTERFKSGAINSFNFRDIQLVYINAEFNRLEAVYNLLDANTEILRLSGSIISEYE